MFLEGVGKGLGDGDRDRAIRLNLACAERWPLLLVGRADDLVTARSCCAAARTSAKVDGVLVGSGSDAGGSSSGFDAAGVDHGFHMCERGKDVQRHQESNQLCDMTLTVHGMHLFSDTFTWKGTLQCSRVVLPLGVICLKPQHDGRSCSRCRCLRVLLACRVRKWRADVENKLTFGVTASKRMELEGCVFRR